MKRCAKCGELKDLVCFSKNKRNKTSGLQSRCKECNRTYYKANRKRVVERVRKNYQKNNSVILKRRAKLRKRPEAKKKKAQVDARYYKENKSTIQVYYKQWAKKNREYLREYCKAWYHENIEHVRMYGRAKEHKRRCMIRNSKNNTLSANEMSQLLIQQPFCSYCGDRGDLEIDHVISVSKNGENNLGNVVVACKSCNCSKGNKELIFWLAGK